MSRVERINWWEREDYNELNFEQKCAFICNDGIELFGPGPDGQLCENRHNLRKYVRGKVKWKTVIRDKKTVYIDATVSPASSSECVPPTPSSEHPSPATPICSIKPHEVNSEVVVPDFEIPKVQPVSKKMENEILSKRKTVPSKAWKAMMKSVHDVEFVHKVSRIVSIITAEKYVQDKQDESFFIQSLNNLRACSSPSRESQCLMKLLMLYDARQLNNIQTAITHGLIKSCDDLPFPLEAQKGESFSEDEPFLSGEDESFSEDGPFLSGGEEVDIIKSSRGSFRERSRSRIQTTCIIGHAIIIIVLTDKDAEDKECVTFRRREYILYEFSQGDEHGLAFEDFKLFKAQQQPKITDSKKSRKDSREFIKLMKQLNTKKAYRMWGIGKTMRKSFNYLRDKRFFEKREALKANLRSLPQLTFNTFLDESVQLGLDLRLSWKNQDEFDHDLTAGWDYYTDVVDDMEIGIGSTLSIRRKAQATIANIERPSESSEPPTKRQMKSLPQKN